MNRINSVCFLCFVLFCNFWAGALAEGQCQAKTDQKLDKESLRRPPRLFDQAFGLALTADDFLSPFFSPFFAHPWTSVRDYIRPWRQLSAHAKDVGSIIKSDKDKFQINLDVQHFAPEEITVKVQDGYVVVEAKHEEKEDQHGYISRQFVRKYSLPEGTDPKTVKSELSSDGVLTVSAPKKHLEVTNEVVVPIARTGPVRTEEAKEQEPACDSETCVESS